ncbi:hypothetical protein Acr_00g0089310 [Actinidia rufa]|uniref:Uncharacterized protein n=1 Tax=Actinidia rufa TaxID=165716 RepID=A0A7J0DXT5_9ERIC|nr:hypothetical protein Acr_00g0089310 [Actinidia rufa]
MVKGDKIMLNPGFIATCMPVYERERMENIRRNNEVCRSLRVKRITPSIGLVQHKCSTAKAKRKKRSNSELDDVDYRHQDNEDDHDDSASSDSFEQEIIKMPHGGRSTHSYPDPQCGDNVMSERVTRSTPRSDMDSQSLPTPITKPLSEELPNNNVASINRRTRGPTRGIKAQRVIDKKGTLPIVIAPQFHAPVGEHAARMASKIGMEVRTHLMDLGVHRWKAIDDTVKAPILQRLTDKFDLQGNPSHVGKIVARQCGRTLSSFSYRLHKNYQKLKDARGEEYARNNPPSYVKPEQWTSLIEKKWSVKKWQCMLSYKNLHSNSELDDVDYRHQDNEDDHDDSASSDSFEQEIIKMPHGGRSTHSYPDPQCGDNVMSERVTRSTPRSDMDSQSLPTPITKPLSEELPNNNVASINRRTRGPTRGIKAQRVIDKKGTLPIVIAPQFHAPVGEHAARMASKIGMEVRTHLMDLGVHRWKAIDDTVKAPILQRLTDKFDLQGNPSHVGKIVARQCGRTLSSFSYRLHKNYQKLKDARGERDGAIPMTQEELSIKVFGPRSGYVTGLGMRPSSSSRSIVGLGDNITYVKQLEQKVQEQADQIQEQVERIEAANNKIHELVEAKEEQGRTLASVMEYLKCQGYTG